MLERWLSRERHVLPYATRDEATAAADARRLELEAAMRREEWGFREEPPDLRWTEDVRRRGHRSSTGAAISMGWQLEDTRLLLLARVTDYICAVVDRAVPVVVVLQPLRRWRTSLQPELFPWRVVVRTSEPELVQARLARSVSSSPGIGVDVAPVIPPEPQLQCRAGDGRRGVAPGRLRGVAGDVYSLTCAHVVDPGCHCAAWTPEHVSETYSGPDAILLRAGNCFDGQDGAAADYVPAEKDAWSRLGREPKLLRLGPSKGNRRGVLLGPMLGFDHEDGWCDMPSLAIRPLRIRYGVVPAHPFKPGFSRPGDSGDCVVGGVDNATWMGMIVQGSRSLSIAHQAPALIEYAERELARRTGGTGIVQAIEYHRS